MAAWKALKAKIKSLFPNMREPRIYRARVKWLRICREGPTAVCYPHGKWYHGATAEEIDGLIDHIHSGDAEPHPLEFTANPLPRP